MGISEDDAEAIWANLLAQGLQGLTLVEFNSGKKLLPAAAACNGLSITFDSRRTVEELCAEVRQQALQLLEEAGETGLAPALLGQALPLLSELGMGMSVICVIPVLLCCIIVVVLLQ